MKQTNPNPSPALPLSGEGVAAPHTPTDPHPDKGGLGGVSLSLILNKRTTAPATDSVALAYDERKRSRLKVTLASGLEAGIFLERGDHLQGGDKLLAEEGSTVVEILAAPEKLIEAIADSPLLFARAAYHLGNRHVPVQILPTDNGGKLRFQADHVLADMVRGLGCTVIESEAPFQPESGAYGSHGGHHHHAEDGPTPDLHNPGHGPHRSVPKIHQFKPR
ncbi:MAG: urease accessory protein [Rhodocyclaceae bacterium]|nr:MAG: urease accessory protein [Rhodocyclaceae bacterium]